MPHGRPRQARSPVSPPLRTTTYGRDKDPDNPIIEELPAEPEVLRTEDWEGEFRDHCVWRENETWHQLIGAGIEGGGGAALLYESADLRNGSTRGRSLLATATPPGLSGSARLLDSATTLLHNANYEDVVRPRRLEDGEFDVDRRDKLDRGDFYAPQSMWTDDGRIRHGDGVRSPRRERAWDAGWSGAMSLPRELSLADDGGLCQRPAPELTELAATTPVTTWCASMPAIPSSCRSRAGRRAPRYRPSRSAEAVELSVLESPDGEERTPIRYSYESEIAVDRSASSTTRRRPATPTPRRPYDAPPLSFTDGSAPRGARQRRHCRRAVSTRPARTPPEFTLRPCGPRLRRR